MLIFLIAGHDTTGYSLSWILIEISRHPEVYAKIKAEIEEHIPPGPSRDHMSMDDLSRLAYMDMVIKEGMRLWPVTSLGSLRILSKDIEYNNMLLPSGSTILMPFYSISRTGIRVLLCTYMQYTYSVLMIYMLN